jgi:cytochrome c-type biogenesis protein CcmH
VADSDTPAAHAIRDTITARLRRGESTDQIRDYVVSRYGESILLEPSSRGIGALVFVIPVAAVIVAAAAIGFRFRHWRSVDSVTVSAADQALVDAARHGPDSSSAPR